MTIQIVTIETFLSFWSQHNSTIIEILLALVILTTLTLAFRSFFSAGRKGSDHSLEGGSLVSPELEGKLEKILEGQKQQADLVAKVAESVSNKQVVLDDSEGDVDDFEIKDGGAKKGAVAEGAEKVKKIAEVRIKESENKVKESEAEIAQLRITLAETQQKMLEMRKDLEQAKANSGPAADVGEGDAALLGKIADLEARLEEYDIISQDLADLPALQSENASLKEQLEQLLKQSMLSEGSALEQVEEEIVATPEEAEESEEEYAAKATKGLVDSNDLQNLNVEDHANALDNQIEAALAMAEFEQAAEALEGATAPASEEAITVSGGEPESSAGDFLITDDMMEELQSAVMEKKEGAEAAKAAKNQTPTDDFPEDVLSKEDADLFDRFNKTVTKKS